MANSWKRARSLKPLVPETYHYNRCTQYNPGNRDNKRESTLTMCESLHNNISDVVLHLAVLFYEDSFKPIIHSQKRHTVRKCL